MGLFNWRKKPNRRAAIAAQSIYHIEFQNVWKTLGGREILRGLSFGIHRGETFVLLGLSGTGKSVSLKHMIGLLDPDYGRVLVNGIDVSKLSKQERLESKKQFGYLFQSGALINWMSIYDNVALPLRELTDLSETEIHRRVMEKLALVNLEEHGHKLPADISGGMKKRAGLARAIVRDPEIILYDEPTSGLDPVMSRGVDRLILKMQKELGVTSVLVTHDMESAYICADRIAMLYQGRIQQLGTPEEIRKTRDPIVKAFVTGTDIPEDATAPSAPADADSAERKRADQRLTEWRTQREIEERAERAAFGRDTGTHVSRPPGDDKTPIRYSPSTDTDDTAET